MAASLDNSDPMEKNDGPAAFYVEADCCLLCGVPEEIALIFSRPASDIAS
jgi:hypothetical protein